MVRLVTYEIGRPVCHHWNSIMSDETRRLTRSLSFIKENTTQIEKILDKLIEDGIIGMDERSQILANPLLENQLHSVIEKIIRKQAYQSFLSALKTTGNNHVVDKIVGLHFPKGINSLFLKMLFLHTYLQLICVWMHSCNLHAFDIG